VRFASADLKATERGELTVRITDPLWPGTLEGMNGCVFVPSTNQRLLKTSAASGSSTASEKSGFMLGQAPEL
jgi:hypothetical protein